MEAGDAAPLPRLRLLDAPRSAEAALHWAASGSGEPDLRIRWVDTLPTTSPLHLVGDRLAVMEEGSLLVGEVGRRTLISLSRLGPGAEILCEPGVTEPALLRPLLAAAGAARGIVATHASAVLFAGRGVLLSGWSHGGKTGLLLALMSAGARFIGDDCVYVGHSPRGPWMEGVPEPISVRSEYLAHGPDLRRRVVPAERLRLAALTGAAAAVRLVPGAGRVRHALLNRARSEAAPEQWFGRARCIYGGPLDRIYILQTWSRSDISVSPNNSQAAAEQLLAAQAGELRLLHAGYMRARYACPALRSPLLDHLEAIQRATLRRVLSGRSLFRIFHPPGARPADVLRAMRPSLED